MNKQSPLCYELKIKVPEEQKEVLSQILEALEVGDFVYGEVDCDLEAEYDPSKIHTDLYEIHQNHAPFILYNEDKEYLNSIQKALEMLFPKTNIPIASDTFVMQEIADQNWRESWKKSFKPVLVQDMFAVIPPWENPADFSQKHKIIIDPGMAFGTGQHETTRLCLEMMLEHGVPNRFFDVGTGSGILAIAAQKLGAKYILGNDIDPECMPVANENAQKNDASTIKFTAEPIFNIEEMNFDMVVANIQSKPLKTLVADILKRTSSNGIVILSGILVVEKEDFIEFLNQAGARVVKTHDLNHWCAIVCTHKN